MPDEKFLGMPYPICPSSRGLLRTQSGVSQIKSDLLALILTNQGERVMLPNFGASLRRFIFEPNDILLREEVRNSLADQIKLWEPRVVIDQIEILAQPEPSDLNSADTLEEIDAILFIRILFFDPENIQEVEELRLEVPIPGV